MPPKRKFKIPFLLFRFTQFTQVLVTGRDKQTYHKPKQVRFEPVIRSVFYKIARHEEGISVQFGPKKGPVLWDPWTQRVQDQKFQEIPDSFGLGLIILKKIRIIPGGTGPAKNENLGPIWINWTNQNSTISGPVPTLTIIWRNLLKNII